MFSTWLGSMLLPVENSLYGIHTISGVKDMADYITINLIDQTKNRRQVIKQLIRQNLIGSSKDLYRKNKYVLKYKL